MLNGVPWALSSGAAWRNTQERFGPWSTVYKRFRDWRNRGFFDLMHKRLHIRMSEQGSIDLESWLIDFTALCATRASSRAREKGAQRNARLRARADPGRSNKQYLHAVRCRRIASALSVVRRTSKRYRLRPPSTGCDSLSEAARASSQTLPVLAGRQGVLRRRVAPVPGSRLNAGSHPSTQHETQTQAELAQVV